MHKIYLIIDLRENKKDEKSKEHSLLENFVYDTSKWIYACKSRMSNWNGRNWKEN